MNQDRLIAVMCGLIAVAIGIFGVLFAVAPQGWRVSSLVRMDPLEPMAEIAMEADPQFAFVFGGHYDGVYSYAIAIDPLAKGRAHTLIDYPAYRYGRVGYGWLAGVLSLGRAAAVPWALLVIGLVSLGLAAYGTSRLATEMGWSSASGLIVVLNPGVLLGLTVDTSEPLSLALAVCGILLWLRGNYVPAVLAMMYLALVKEPFLAVPAGLFVWELVQARRTGTGITSELRRSLFTLALVPMPLAAWWVYVHAVFGEWSINQPWLVAPPIWGWLDGLHRVGQMSVGGNFEELQIGVANLPLLLCVGAAFLLGFIQSIRIRSPLDAIFIFLMIAFSLLSWWQLVFPKDMIRILAVPLTFLPAVLVHHVYRPSDRTLPELNS